MNRSTKHIMFAICLGIFVSASFPAHARNAQGAFIVNTNSMDPTHAHKLKVQKTYKLTDSVVEKQGCSCGKRLVLQHFNNGQTKIIGSRQSQ